MFVHSLQESNFRESGVLSYEQLVFTGDLLKNADLVQPSVHEAGLPMPEPFLAGVCFTL